MKGEGAEDVEGLKARVAQLEKVQGEQEEWVRFVIKQNIDLQEQHNVLAATNKQLQAKLAAATKRTKKTTESELSVLVRSLESDKEALQRKISELTTEWAEKDGEVRLWRSKLQAMAEEVGKHEARVRAVEGELGLAKAGANALRAEKEALEAELGLSWEKARVEMSGEVRVLEGEVERARAEQERLLAKLKEKDGALQDLQAQADKALAQRQDALAQLQALQHTNKQLQHDTLALRQDLAIAKQLADTQAQQLKHARGDLGANEQRYEALRSQLDEQGKARESLVEQLQSERDARKAKEREVGEGTRRERELREEGDSLRRRLLEVEKKCEEGNKERGRLETEVKALRESMVATKGSSSQHFEALTALQAQFEECRGNLKRAEAQAREWEDKCAQQTKMADALKFVEQKATASLEQVTAERDALATRVSELEKSRAASPPPGDGPDRGVSNGSGNSANADDLAQLKQQAAKAKLQQQKSTSQIYWLKQTLEKTAKQLQAERDRNELLSQRLGEHANGGV